MRAAGGVMGLLFLPTLVQALPQELDATSPLAYSGAAWSPYLVGALIGMLSWMTFYFSHKALGASSAYANVAGLLGKIVAPQRVARLPYYQEKPPRLNWSLMLLAGISIGAFLAAWSGNEITGQWLPPMWSARFGEGSLWLRLPVAFVGGGLMAFGARLAGGCTSGHGISGTLQLSVGSWVAVACFFISGIVVAMALYRI